MNQHNTSLTNGHGRIRIRSQVLEMQRNEIEINQKNFLLRKQKGTKNYLKMKQNNYDNNNNNKNNNNK